jgi:hypothetical protein
MRRHFNILILLALVATCTLSGCKKEEDDDNNNDPIVSTSEFSAIIDGVQFKASPPIIGVLDSEDNEIRIWEFNNMGDLSMVLNGDITPGTYTIGSGSAQSLHWAKDSGFQYWARPGTIIVTKHDTVNRKLEGTFTATLESSMPPTLSLTNGVFKVSYNVL